MPELPEHVKAEADKAVSEAGANKMPVKDMNSPQAVDNYADRGKEMDAVREQKREDAQQEKKQPDKG
jgi:hypothetical protein